MGEKQGNDQIHSLISVCNSLLHLPELTWFPSASLPFSDRVGISPRQARPSITWTVYLTIWGWGGSHIQSTLFWQVPSAVFL